MQTKSAPSLPNTPRKDYEETYGDDEPGFFTRMIWTPSGCCFGYHQEEIRHEPAIDPHAHLFRDDRPWFLIKDEDSLHACKAAWSMETVVVVCRDLKRDLRSDPFWRQVATILIVADEDVDTFAAGAVTNSHRYSLKDHHSRYETSRPANHYKFGV